MSNASEGKSSEQPSTDVREFRIAAGHVELQCGATGHGDAPVVVLLHGLYDRWQVWQETMRELGLAGYHAIAPDLRGHSGSSRPESGYDLADYARDVEGLLDQLDVAGAVIAGHSLGALVAIELASESPERVRALALIDPPLEPNAATREWLSALLDAKRGSEEQTYQALQEMLWHLDEAEWRRQTEWLCATADGPFEALIASHDESRRDEAFDALARVSAPALLVQADPAAGGACSETAVQRVLLALPGAALHRFPDTGHNIHRERPSELAAVLLTFLGELL